MDCDRMTPVSLNEQAQSNEYFYWFVLLDMFVRMKKVRGRTLQQTTYASNFMGTDRKPGPSFVTIKTCLDSREDTIESTRLATWTIGPKHLSELYLCRITVLNCQAEGKLCIQHVRYRHRQRHTALL
jgi:hypothetical protein